MADQTSSGRYHLEVPIDASGIEGFKNDQSVKVLAQGPKGPLASSVVKLDDKGHGVAKLAFAEAPGGIRVILGPQDATDEELTGLNTIGVDVPARRWAGSALKLSPIKIAAYYWWWWFRWCRTFTISGKVLCPDGSRSRARRQGLRLRRRLVVVVLKFAADRLHDHRHQRRLYHHVQVVLRLVAVVVVEDSALAHRSGADRPHLAGTATQPRSVQTGAADRATVAYRLPRALREPRPRISAAKPRSVRRRSPGCASPCCGSCHRSRNSSG